MHLHVSIYLLTLLGMYSIEVLQNAVKLVDQKLTRVQPDRFPIDVFAKIMKESKSSLIVCNGSHYATIKPFNAGVMLLDSRLAAPILLSEKALSDHVCQKDAVFVLQSAAATVRVSIHYKSLNCSVVIFCTSSIIFSPLPCQQWHSHIEEVYILHELILVKKCTCSQLDTPNIIF